MGGKRTLVRGQERGVAAVAGDREGHQIGKDQFPKDGPVAADDLWALIDGIQRRTDDGRDH